MTNRQTLLAVCGLACGAASVAQGQSFTGVGDLSGGSFRSEAMGVSSDGLTVVGSSEFAAGQTRAFTFAGGTMTPLDDVDVYRPVVAYAISDNGVVIGKALGPGGSEAYKLHNGTFRALGGTVPGGALGSCAYAIAADGRTVIGSREIAGPKVEACLWFGPAPLGLGFLDPSDDVSVAFGISADGSVTVGGSAGPGGQTVAFMSSGGVMVALPTFGGTFTEAHAISDDGKVIVGAGRGYSSGTHAFSYAVASGVLTDLGELDGGDDFSDALAVNADGSVIVGQSGQASGTVAMIWDATNGMRNLKDVLVAQGVSNLAGWTLTRANGVSNDGLVVCGTGINPSGFTEGWVAVLLPPAPPCPADFDGDGTVDFFDYDAFVMCFEGGACPPGKTADFDQDGTVDFFDYDACVVAFETPC
mgnify:CR=1 FL=1